ncbi:hypothetical protein N431DRAFT_335360 [Stipitochalara longipes BDJ]|nr:hypothetical protein N431DRAFT_335360 [Stipitochalara longipes BDJ]
MVTLKNEEPVDQGDVFTLFPKLPPELPNKIWKNACFVSRAVDIWQVPVGENDFGKACLKAFRNRIWVYKSHSRTPSILHTSMEARSVGLEHYELSFGTKITAKIGPTEIDISIPPRIYVHFDCDMICPIPTSLIKPGKPYGQDSIFFILGCLKNAPMTQRLALPDYWVDDMCCSLIIERFVVKEILVYRGFLHRFRPFEIRILISLKLEDTHGELEEGELGLLAIVDDTKKFFGYRRTDEAIKTWGKIPGDGSHRFSRPRV